MTQTPMPTKHKIPYPKGRMLLIRDCTVDICLNNNPGAVLLSVLLFWYDNPWQGDWEREGLHEFCMSRTQAQIEEAACHQIDAKTIHDTAIPLLRLLGYLHVGTKMNGDLYVLHIDKIIAAFAACEQSRKEKNPDLLKGHIRSAIVHSVGKLESALIEMTEDELESALINKSPLYLLLERTRMAIRSGSNCKRGRKTRQEKAAEAQFSSYESIREIHENQIGECVATESATQQKHTHTSSSLDWNAFPDSYSHDPLATGSDEEFTDNSPTVEGPAIRLEKGLNDAQQSVASLPVPEPLSPVLAGSPVAGDSGTVEEATNVDISSQGATSPPAAASAAWKGTHAGGAQKPPAPGKGKRAPEMPLAAIELLDAWDREFGLSGRPQWVLKAATDIVTRLKGDIEDVKRVVERMRRLAKYRDKILNLEMVANEWGLLTQQRPATRAAPTEENHLGWDGKTDLRVYGLQAMLARSQQKSLLAGT